MQSSSVFKLVSFKVMCVGVVKNGQLVNQNRAIVILRLHGKRVKGRGTGDGPVNAIESAFRAALRTMYPHIDFVSLTGFRVENLSSESPTSGAAGRVDIKFGHQGSALQREYTAESPSIIGATVVAMEEGLNKAISKRAARQRHRTTAAQTM